jgi:hypothetical protein
MASQEGIGRNYTCMFQRSNDQAVCVDMTLLGTVNTSGKAGAQIPHPPWEMIHPPGGDNAVCR